MSRNSISLRINYLLISLATVVALVLIASAYSVRVLRVSLMPDESPSIQRRKLQPLTDYLVQKIGIKMEFRPKASGDALVESFVLHELDLVWIDGANLAQAKMRSTEQVIPLVQREADENTRSVTTTAPGHDDYTWAVRADMDADLRQQLTDAFLALNKNNARDKWILDLQRAGRFIPAKAENHSGMGASRSLKVLENF
ncbi:MAG: PhnD/SsuA/transferrin family substrate-binding protein [Gallionella sp.]